MAYEHEKMAQEKMAAERAYGAQTAQGYAGRDVPSPVEPTMRARLQETLGYLAELTDIQHSIRMALVGPEPTDVPPIGGLANKATVEPPIEFLLARVCEHAAMLASEARSIRNRL